MHKLYLYLSCILVVFNTSRSCIVSPHILKGDYKYNYNFFPIVEGLDNIARPASTERPNACITAPRVIGAHQLRQFTDTKTYNL
jgi:hypothetical protein